MVASAKLTDRHLKAFGPGKFNDGAGLWFVKQSDTSAQWVLRVTVHGRRREMGLGGYPDVSLKAAREEAQKWRSVAKAGQDPIKQREKERREAERNLHVLRDVAIDAFESRKASLKGDGKAGRWFSPLEIHVLPKLGKVPVADIDAVDIRNALQPIWHIKASTAEKALHRLGVCLKHGAALGLDVDLQAVAKARALLGKQRHKVNHIAALHWSEVPDFYESLGEGSITHLALKLLILTAVRSKPLRFLHEDQLDGDIWTIPSEAMKGRKDATTEFRVPLSKEAMAVIEQARPLARDGFLFPSVRRGVISDATMSRFMERKRLEARPHGFRSSFRTWASKEEKASFEVAETALGHVVGTKVTRSYERTDFLEERRALMESWANFVVDKTTIKQAH